MIFLGGSFSEEEMNKPFLALVWFLLRLAVMVAFSSVFLWVGFGPGEREFQTTSSFGGITSTGEGSSFLGRFLFGGAGVLFGLVILWVSYASFRKLIQKSL